MKNKTIKKELQKKMAERIFKVSVNEGKGAPKTIILKHFIDLIYPCFEQFKNKVFNRFPLLKNENIKMYWTDPDGDNILIFNEEDFRMYIESASCRLCIEKEKSDSDSSSDSEAVVSKCRAKKTVTIAASPPPVTATNAPLPCNSAPYHNAVCDECDQMIRGFRYQCIQCPDFDLCAGCETKGLHKEHLMVRIPVPTEDYRKIGKCLRKIMTRNRRDMREEAKHCHFRRGGRPGSYREPGLVGHIMTSIGDIAAGAQTLASNFAYPPETPASSSNKAQANASPSNAAPTGEKSGVENQMKRLSKIMTALSEVMNPLSGVDIVLDINENTPTASTSSQIPNTQEEGAPKAKMAKTNEAENVTTNVPLESQSNPAQNDTTKGSQTSNTPIRDNSMQTSVGAEAALYPNLAAVCGGPIVSITSTPENVSDERRESRGHSPIEIEWTIINDEGEGSVGNRSRNSLLHPTDSSNVATNAAQLQAKLADLSLRRQEENEIDVQIPTASAPIQPPVQQNITFHPNPTINDAIQTMMSMGFSNEGGWLTQLVSHCQGDISKSLDLLQPPR